MGLLHPPLWVPQDPTLQVQEIEKHRDKFHHPWSPVSFSISVLCSLWLPKPPGKRKNNQLWTTSKNEEASIFVYDHQMTTVLSFLSSDSDSYKNTLSNSQSQTSYLSEIVLVTKHNIINQEITSSFSKTQEFQT